LNPGAGTTEAENRLGERSAPAFTLTITCRLINYAIFIKQVKLVLSIKHEIIRNFDDSKFGLDKEMFLTTFKVLR